MKKLLFILLLPVFANAQTVQDTTAVKSPLSVIKKTTARDTLQIAPAFISQVNKATSDISAVGTQVSNLTSTVNSINAITTQQGVAIQGLQTTINGLQVTPPKAPLNIGTSTYSVTEADNGGCYQLITGCVITVPNDLPVGFQCVFYRSVNGSSGLVEFKGTYRARLNPTRIQFNGAAMVKCVAPGVVYVTGDITR